MSDIENTEFESNKSKKKMVEIIVPIDPANRKEKTIPASVNGEFYTIERGKRVKVPDYIANVIHLSEQIDESARDFIDSESRVSE